MSDGVIGLGTLLKIGDAATPEVFTAIAEVKDERCGCGSTGARVSASKRARSSRVRLRPLVMK